ncbi:MAG: HlyD family efflux transporter periplasmic adaptor subunit [Lachnospiraceae bacterium]|nr:HlyD family efflux transporter periplasmic adaptor subunit [Lachnospiraceae bacterium]
MSKKQPTLSLDREDLDAQLELAAQKRKKQKRKKLIVRLALIGAGLVVVLAIVGVIVGVIMAGKAKSQMVNVTHATTAELTQEVKINGTVQSENVQHFYSIAPIKVQKAVPVGTFVKKGDPIITFDPDSYAEALREVEINDKMADNKNKSQKVEDGNLSKKLADAKAEVAKYEAEIKKNQEKIDSYEKDEGLEKFRENVKKQVALCQAEQKRLEGIMADTTLTDEQRADYAKKYNEQQEIINNVSKQLSDSDEDYQKNKSDLESNKLKLESAKANVESYQKALGNSYDRENTKLSGELSTLKSGSEYEDLQKYENGCLIAPFDGIVTASFVSDGMTTSSITGTEIVTFASIEDVSVTISVSKKDLAKIKEGQKVTVTILDKDYEGEVTRIARMAVTSGSTSSVTAVIKVKNPDDSIYLGIEAKNVIITAHEDSCIQIPSESVNVDSEGYFVYIVNDMNIVEKRRVEIGISSESFTQIKEGVTEDDKIVSFVTSSVREGAVVVPVDEDQMGGLMGGIGVGAGDVTVTTEVTE